MNASIDKAVAPLLVSALTALFPLLSGGSADYATLLTAVTGLGTFGAVYFVTYSAHFVNKAAVALIVPLLVALASALSSGDFNSPELYLAIQAIVGAVVTYLARRVDITVDAAAVNEGTGASTRRR